MGNCVTGDKAHIRREELEPSTSQAPDHLEKIV